MRRRDAKVGKAVHHDTTNRHLGTITSTHNALVMIDRPDGSSIIAAYGEIVRCDCTDERLGGDA
jgi:hypothetical protein